MADNKLTPPSSSQVAKYRTKTIIFSVCFGIVLIFYIWFWIQNPKKDGYGYT